MDFWQIDTWVMCGSVLALICVSLLFSSDRLTISQFDGWERHLSFGFGGGVS